MAYWVQLLHNLLPFQTMLSVEHELVEPGAEAGEDSMGIILAPLADCPWEVLPTIKHHSKNYILYMNHSNTFNLN